MDRNPELETEMIRMDKGTDMEDRQERNKYISGGRCLQSILIYFFSISAQPLKTSLYTFSTTSLSH